MVNICKQCECSFLGASFIPVRKEGFCSTICKSDFNSTKEITPEQTRQKLLSSFNKRTSTC